MNDEREPRIILDPGTVLRINRLDGLLGRLKITKHVLLCFSAAVFVSYAVAFIFAVLQPQSRYSEPAWIIKWLLASFIASLASVSTFQLLLVVQSITLGKKHRLERAALSYTLREPELVELAGQLEAAISRARGFCHTPADTCRVDALLEVGYAQLLGEQAGADRDGPSFVTTLEEVADLIDELQGAYEQRQIAS